MARFVDLSHVIEAGMTTYPGLPGPEITPHLTRAELPDDGARLHAVPAPVRGFGTFPVRAYALVP